MYLFHLLLIVMDITYFSGSAYAQILSNIWRDIFCILTSQFLTTPLPISNHNDIYNITR